MRKHKDITVGPYSIRVYGPNSFGEFEARVYKDGKLDPAKTAFEDSKQDAIDTAKAHARWARKKVDSDS